MWTTQLCSGPRGQRSGGGEENNPTWLDHLRSGDGLAPSQVNFIAGIRRRMLQRRSRQQSASPTGDDQRTRTEEVRRNFNALQNNFEALLRLLRTSGPAEDRFRQRFPEWESLRKDAIKRLLKIADALDNWTLNCRASSLAGSLVSLIGGALSLAGANGQALETASRVMMGAGNITSVGANTLEAIVSRRKLEEYKEVEKRDRRCLEDLLEFVRIGSQLNRVVENIQSIDYREDVLTAAERLHAISRQNLSEERREEEVQRAIEAVDVPPGTEEQTADTVSMLTAVSMFFERHFLLFQQFIKVVTIAVYLWNGYRSACDVARAINGSYQCVPGDQGWALGFGMALDAANIALISRQGLVSAQAQYIRNVVTQLQNELDELRRIYRQM